MKSWCLIEALTCSRREDGLSCRHGVKPPLTHLQIPNISGADLGILREGVLGRNSSKGGGGVGSRSAGIFIY